MKGNINGGGGAEFVPEGIRWLEHFCRRLFQENPVVKLLEPARACLDCGLVWTNLDLGKLRRVIQQEGVAVGVKKEEPEV